MLRRVRVVTARFRWYVAETEGQAASHSPLHNDPNKSLKQEGYGSGEDWKEAGRAVRDRAGQVIKEAGSTAKEALKQGREAIKGVREEPVDPAKQHPPESVNEYSGAKSVKDMAAAVREKVDQTTGKVKELKDRVKNGLKGLYDRVESSTNEPGGPAAPSDDLGHTNDLLRKPSGKLSDEELQKKGNQLRHEENEMNIR